MRIRLKYAGIISEITGKVSDEIELGNDISISDLLKKLASLHGRRFKEQVFNYEINRPASGVLILLNGKLIHGNFDRKLNDEDFVSIIPMVSGG